MKNTQHLEKFAGRKDHRIVEREDHNGVRIVITDGGPYYERKQDYPLGFYETAFWLFKDENIICGQVLEFDALHDIKQYTDMTRPIARANAAKQAAIHMIEVSRIDREGH